MKKILLRASIKYPSEYQEFDTMIPLVCLTSQMGYEIHKFCRIKFAYQSDKKKKRFCDRL